MSTVIVRFFCGWYYSPPSGNFAAFRVWCLSAPDPRKPEHPSSSLCSGAVSGLWLTSAFTWVHHRFALVVPQRRAMSPSTTRRDPEPTQREPLICTVFHNCESRAVHRRRTPATQPATCLRNLVEVSPVHHPLATSPHHCQQFHGLLYVRLPFV